MSQPDQRKPAKLKMSEDEYRRFSSRCTLRGAPIEDILTGLARAWMRDEYAITVQVVKGGGGPIRSELQQIGARLTRIESALTGQPSGAGLTVPAATEAQVRGLARKTEQDYEDALKHAPKSKPGRRNTGGASG